jgi:DNA-binding transcriptional ArsR family regulator
MAIPLLGEIERLINEHGSAAILKERLALANDQYNALEGKLADAKARADELATDNERLRRELTEAREQLRTLQTRSDARAGERLDETGEAILRFLAEHEDVTSVQIARAIGKNDQVVTYHLTEMDGQDLVQASYSAYEDPQWSLDHDGRGYLIRRGLLG